MPQSTQLFILQAVAIVGVIALTVAGKVNGDACIAFMVGIVVPSPVVGIANAIKKNGNGDGN